MARFAGLMALVLLAGCSAAPEPAPAPTAAPPPTPAPSSSGCGSTIDRGPLPQWARGGFTGDARVPHLLSRGGDILAVLFGDPLTVPKPAGANNKILWVSHAPFESDPLIVDARLDGTTTTATVKITGGPGPSIVDMPKPGCWHFTLHWSGHTDAMDLVYAAGA
jgi:hypothetical protein